MTSNIGSREVAERGNGIGFGAGSRKLSTTLQAEYMRAAERTFAPEFLNRIDEVILFASLSERDSERIVELEVASLKKRLERLGYRLRLTPTAVRELAQRGFSARYGARALRRTIVEHIEEPIASMIVANEIGEGCEIVVRRTRSGITIKASGAAAI
jgi:ATP-dependent Clp protease ATP-binding subunit ClpC